MSLTPEQIQARTRGIGGSDAAAVCGRHPSKTPLQVWMAKVWGVEKQLEGEWIEWGNRLEPVIAQAAAERLDLPVTHPKETFVHPKHPLLLANIDGLLGDDTILECKNIDKFRADRLGPEGTDRCLEEHLFQVQHYMEVCDKSKAVVAYLVGGNHLALYPVERDREFGARLVAFIEGWWAKHVVPQVAPPETKPSVLAEYLAKKYPVADGSVLVANGAAIDALADLANITAAFRDVEKRRESAIVAVKSIMGAAEELWAEGIGRARWKGKKSRRFTTKFDQVPDEGAEEMQ